MRPIKRRTDEVLGQVLRCVEFRLPTEWELSPEAQKYALALRYGLVGVAAAHHLLLSFAGEDEDEVILGLRSFSRLVEDHLRGGIIARLPAPVGPDFARQTALLAQEPLTLYVPKYHRLWPLDFCIERIEEEFVLAHRDQILGHTLWLCRHSLSTRFQAASHQSGVFAMNFFERRTAGLEEVREIALLNE